MGAFSYTDLIEVDLGKLGAAADDWAATAAGLEKLSTEVYSGLLQLSDGADWAGLNAAVTKDFVRKTAKEVADLHLEAQSIVAVLQDAHGELTHVQKRAREVSAEARKGDPTRQAGPDPGLLVSDGPSGTVKVTEAFCGVDGTSQRTKDLMQWYADTLTGLVSHAAEIDAAITRALKRSHGSDPHNAGHATYTSLDEDQLPRATKLASLGDEANTAQRAELRRLWSSLSPQARAELWAGHKNDLLAAGLLAPSIRQAAPDRGSGPHGAEEPGAEERRTREKMNLIAEAADWTGDNHRPSLGQRHERPGRSDGPPPHHGHRPGIRHGGQQFRQALRSGRIRPEPRSSAAAGRARARGRPHGSKPRAAGRAVEVHRCRAPARSLPTSSPCATVVCQSQSSSF
ncbi:hypothetical protein [Streptomyces sp. NPDC056323]|uniref:hypothetical protein n=1 Tax=Streptomyces sp. NPDC056323 TaxID=3345784 RepID=UPI0035DCF635